MPLTEHSKGPQTGSLQFLTASEHEEVAHDEFVGALPTEEVETAVAQAVTLTERDVGHETCQAVSAMLVESLKGTPMQPMPDIRTEFWETSIGRFRFTLEQLPSDLRIIYALLTVATNVINERRAVL